MNDPDATASDALRWLRFSREDLDIAGLLLTRHPPASRHVCWLTQQAAEKALKAALDLDGIEFPFTHDLDALRNSLPEGWAVRTAHAELAELTQWAVETRYPGDWPWDHCCSRLSGGGLQTTWGYQLERRQALISVTRTVASSQWRWRGDTKCTPSPG